MTRQARRRPAVFVARMTAGAFLLRLGARLEPRHRYEVTSEGSPGAFTARPIPASWGSTPTRVTVQPPRARRAA